MIEEIEIAISERSLVCADNIGVKLGFFLLRVQSVDLNFCCWDLNSNDLISSTLQWIVDGNKDTLFLEEALSHIASIGGCVSKASGETSVDAEFALGRFSENWVNDDLDHY